MITLQHSAIYALALYQKVRGNMDEFEKRFHDEIPWVLLPDAIRAYTGARQTSHFEKTPDKLGCSWMEFPYPDYLKGMVSPEEGKKRMEKSIYKADNYPSCVIGEDTSIEMFDSHNWWHPFFWQIRCHLMQDVILDETLRNVMVDCTKRFEDVFVPHHNRTIVMNGQELRQQVAAFEQVGFLYLCEKIIGSTDGYIILDQKWFDDHVLLALQDAYSDDLAKRTYNYMKIPQETQERMETYNGYRLTDADLAKVYIAEDLKKVLDDMYSTALIYTARQL